MLATAYHAQPARSRTSAPLDETHVADDAAWLNCLFGNQEGWLEVAVGKARRSDPSKIDVFPPKPAWDGVGRFLPYTCETADAVARKLLHLASKYGNVYTSRSLYSRPERSRKYALPSRIIFLDDVPASGDYSALVETSQGNHQAYYLLDTPADAATIADLQRRAAEAHGADPSGADIEQVVRIPHSFNTKRGGWWLVRLVYQNDRQFTVAELEARWPAVETRSSAELVALEGELRAAVRHNLGRIDAIMRRIKPHTETYKQLHGERLCRDSNNNEPNTSATRYALACNLRKGFGLPDAEIIALLLHFDLGARERKGDQWLEDDVMRCIEEAHSMYPDAKTEPTRGGTSCAAKPLPQSQRRTRGRQRKLTPESYLYWLRKEATSGTTVMLSRRDIADALQVHVCTVDRLERVLRDQGRIERRTNAQRTFSYVVLLGDVGTSTNTDELTQQVLADQPEIEQQEAVKPASETYVGVTHAPDNTSQPDAGSDQPQEAGASAACVPPSQAPAPEIAKVEAVEVRVSLSDAMTAVIASLDAEGQRITLQRARARLDQFFTDHGWTPAAIERGYNAAIQRRHWQRQEDRLQRMSVRELRAWQRCAEHRTAEGHKHGNPSLAAWGAGEQRRVDQELVRRKQAWNVDHPAAPSLQPDLGLALPPKKPSERGFDASRGEQTTIKGVGTPKIETTTGRRGKKDITETHGTSRGFSFVNVAPDDPWFEHLRLYISQRRERGAHEQAAWAEAQYETAMARVVKAAAYRKLTPVREREDE